MVDLTTTPVTSPRLARGYEEHRRYVLGVLARRCGWLEPDERENTLQDAWVVLLEKAAAGELWPERMRPAQVRAYLVQTAINKALDEGKRVGRRRSEHLDELSEPAFEDPGASPEDVVAANFDAARVREVVSELPERQQTIVKLRYYLGRSPQEIQRYLGITERAYRRDLERAMKVVADGYELVSSGRFCDSRRSLVRAYVAGIAGPNRARDARDHLSNCPGCSRWAVELREEMRRAAGVLPMPLLAVEERERLVHVVDLATGVREHLTSTATRLDPNTGGLLAGTRPGAVLGVLASCAAVAGGATLCVTKLPAHHRPAPAVVHHRATPAAQAPAARARSTVVRFGPSTTATTAASRTSAAAARKARAKAATPRDTVKRLPRAVASKPAVAAANEFGLEGAGEPVGGSPSVVPAPARTAAPRNAAPQEWDP